MVLNCLEALIQKSLLEHSSCSFLLSAQHSIAKQFLHNCLCSDLILLLNELLSLVVGDLFSLASIAVGKHVGERFTEQRSMVNLGGCVFALTTLVV
jgi:hypothetical protein